MSAEAQAQPAARLFLARVDVTLKPTVNDPQGLTILGALRSLGFGNVERVRAGKYMEITLSAPDDAQARARVEEMCRRLLANPVIEDYSFDLVPVQSTSQ